MPDAALSQDVTVGSYFENSAGPITGVAANFTVTVTNRATGATVTSGAPTENPASSGYYEFTINSAFLTGRMRLRVVYSNTTNELYSEFFLSVGDVPSWARTRRQLRARIATRLNRGRTIWQKRLSASASNTTTTCYLPNLVVGGANEFRGGWVWFGSGANAGQERLVTEWDADTFVLTWGPALGTAVTTNDWVEIYPPHLQPSVINEKIEDAIAALRDRALILIDEQPYDTDGDTQEWTLPSDLRYVHRVGLVRDDDSEFLYWLPNSSWGLLPNRILRTTAGVVSPESPFREYLTPGAIADGYKLRVLGMVAPDPPLYDDSFVDILPDAVIDDAALRMALDLSHQPEYRQMVPFLNERARQSRLAASVSLPGGSREVRQ